MTQIDWSKAPEGATHWTPESRVVCQFLKFDKEWFWFGEGWVQFGPGNDWMTQQLAGVISRPEPVDTQVWTGEGLPPVGTVCIITPHNNIWGFSDVADYLCKVLAYHDDFVWVDLSGASGVPVATRTDKVDFKPARTPEQIAADKRKSEIDEMINRSLEGHNAITIAQARIVCEALHKVGYRNMMADAEEVKS